jgi:hypothetical protein
MDAPILTDDKVNGLAAKYQILRNLRRRPTAHYTPTSLVTFEKFVQVYLTEQKITSDWPNNLEG